MTGRMGGLQVSIFDVSDSTNPLLVHRYSLTDDRSSSTKITGDRWRRGDGDHLALGFFPEQGVVTVPVQTHHRRGQNGRVDFPGDFIDLPGIGIVFPGTSRWPAACDYSGCHASTKMEATCPIS